MINSQLNRATATLLLVFATSASVSATSTTCTIPWTDFPTTSPYYGALCNSAEHMELPTTIQGTIPPWLEGVMYRNVPGQYSFGDDQVRHWFDGMSMYVSMTLNATTNRMSIQAKFANTTSMRNLQETNAYNFTGFGTYPRPGRLTPNSTANNASTRGSGRGMVGNNDVSILSLGGKFFATTDAISLVEFDPITLSTISSEEAFQFDDNLTTKSNGMGVTHGPYDATTGEYFNYVTDGSKTLFGGPAEVYIYSINGTAQWENASMPWSRRTVAQVQTTNNTYAHSFGLTTQYVVWLEQRGYVIDLLNFVTGSTVLDALNSVPQQTSVFLLVHRVTGEEHRIVLDDPSFGCIYHTGNTFEDVDGSVVYDTVRYPNCDAYHELEVQEMLLHPERMTGGVFVRCRIGSTLDSVVCNDILPDDFAMFPWYNKQFHMKPYRYAYTTLLQESTPRQGGDGREKGWDTHATVRKLDLHLNTSAATFVREGYLFTEALFVPQFPDNMNPSPDIEDAGALMFVAYNITARASELIALDAASMNVLFIAQLPFVVPLHLHGIFCKPRPSSAQARQFCLWN